MKPIDLAPAQWIWWPSQRTLPNSFVLFRREIEIDGPIVRALGHISADSRYLLRINGARVQWGPAPCDPRHAEADPFDALPCLQNGKNVLSAEVLHYGQGDGTWAGGKPGFLLRLDIETAAGVQTVVSDENWLCLLDRAHRPGQHKRWFLRALQEEFDARLHPHGWPNVDFAPDKKWLPAMVVAPRADKPALCGPYDGNDLGDGAAPADCSLSERAIPMLRESWLPTKTLAQQGRVRWKRDPADWFESRTPDSFEIESADVARQEDGQWIVDSTDDANGVFLTFEWDEQIVGWPGFEIEAPAGTVVEMMTQESHAVNGPLWLDTHTFSWSRFICREGKNRFESFDFESLRWLQLHVRSSHGAVTIGEVGVRRREFPRPHEPRFRCDEPDLQRLFDAALNTLKNSAQETCVDGMGRERQQYSGDGSHQLRAVRLAWGETQLPARFLKTWSLGQTHDGFFLDCWPGFDRMARLMQRQINTTIWGPLLDHGVGFGFDCWHHFWESGETEAVREVWPCLHRFAQYLLDLRDSNGLLPVENLGVPSVWIDHDAYQQQRHKTCAFNLYAAAMLEHAFAPLSRVLGEDESAQWARNAASELRAATVSLFWCAQSQLFVANLPWDEAERRLCDRSLATALLYDQCPDGQTANVAQTLAEAPDEMGFSYPCNAGWRHHALAKMGRVDVVLSDWRERWATMASVRENNTIQETWLAAPDSRSQWSHCAVIPLNVAISDIAGIRPLAPGFERIQIAPQLGDLNELELTAHTPRGPIFFAARRADGGHRVEVDLPCAAQLQLPNGESGGELPVGKSRFTLEL